MLAADYVVTQVSRYVYTWASEIASHTEYIHMQDMLTRETHKYLRPVGMWAQEDAKHIGM